MSKTVMVVDDQEDNRISIKALLEHNGYNVITASDGQDCLDKLKESKPDLILLDIMMPGIPVREVVSKIKDIKICYLSIVCTAEAERDQLLKTENVIGFMQKPFGMKELLNKVNKYIKI